MIISVKLFTITGGLALVCGILFFPALQHAKHDAKGASADQIQKQKTEEKRLSWALAALKKGDQAQMPAIRVVLSELKKGDRYRPWFAKALDERGEHAMAFNLESERMHFLELSVPNDSETSFYASLADKTGHPDEGTWARSRLGTNGHFRVWEMGALGALAHMKGDLGKSDRFDHIVSRFMQEGKLLYPRFQGEIDSLRDKVLRFSPSQIQAMHDDLASPNSVRP